MNKIILHFIDFYDASMFTKLTRELIVLTSYQVNRLYRFIFLFNLISTISED